MVSFVREDKGSDGSLVGHMEIQTYTLPPKFAFLKLPRVRELILLDSQPSRNMDARVVDITEMYKTAIAHFPTLRRLTIRCPYAMFENVESSLAGASGMRRYPLFDIHLEDVISRIKIIQRIIERGGGFRKVQQDTSGPGIEVVVEHHSTDIDILAAKMRETTLRRKPHYQHGTKGTE
ncbi:hypothetical protein BGX23_009864 [Mortierella sp. AD031]|nr:hypothetical protein BGX23_009864 [Mortierella sp. AD031]